MLSEAPQDLGFRWSYWSVPKDRRKNGSIKDVLLKTYPEPNDQCLILQSLRIYIDVILKELEILTGFIIGTILTELDTWHDRNKQELLDKVVE